MSGLGLRELRRANYERQLALLEHGTIRSSIEWSGSKHIEKVDDELAELVKAFADYRAGGSRKALCDEIADVLICLDLFAMAFGVDLSEATVSKFNERSAEWGIPVRLGEHEKSREVE